MATTVEIPLTLLAVSLANANAFWQAKDGTNFDYGYVAFLDGVAGTAFYHGIVPVNVNATPNWDITIHHGVNSGAGGNVILDVSAKDFADGATIDAALTSLEADRSLATGAAGLVQIDRLATTGGSTFDGDEAIAAGAWLIVQVTRDGANASDTLSAQWNLFNVMLRVDL